MKKVFVLIAASFVAGPQVVGAQELTYSDTGTMNCIEETVCYGGLRECIGTSTDACMSDSPGGDTTVGMAGCFDRELQFWDARLNSTYRALRTQDEAASPDMAAALMAMQRAWIPYRDARCDYARSLWGGGTGGGPATLACLMVTTAEQVLVLEQNIR